MQWKDRFYTAVTLFLTLFNGHWKFPSLSLLEPSILFSHHWVNPAKISQALLKRYHGSKSCSKAMRHWCRWVPGVHLSTQSPLCKLNYWSTGLGAVNNAVYLFWMNIWINRMFYDMWVKYWVGQKVHLDFSIASDRKPWMNFLSKAI